MIFLAALLLFSCSACGNGNQSSGSSEAGTGKILLNGTPVKWDQFPMPTAEAFGLTGEDTTIYNAIVQVYNPKTYSATFSQSPYEVTDLSLPAFEVYEEAEDGEGNTVYYGLFYECDYNIGNNTIIHYHANISKALNDAVELDMISVNPIKKSLRPKKVEHNGNYYTLEEAERLIRLVKGDGVEFPVLMAAFYGLRRSEIMGLRWQAIDFWENTITISRTVVQTRVDGKTAVVEKDRAKNKKSYRTLPLVPQYKELLLQMRAHQEDCRKMCGNCWQETGYVYVNDMGQPVKPNYVTQHFQLVLQKTGMRKITFHELRHTCASLLLKSGVPMKNIQEWLGHSSYSTTANIYAHLDAASKEETSTAMAGKLNISGNLLGMQSGTTLLPAEEQRKELG